MLGREIGCRIEEALAFVPKAVGRVDRVQRYLEGHPEFLLKEKYRTE